MYVFLLFSFILFLLSLIDFLYVLLKLLSPVSFSLLHLRITFLIVLFLFVTYILNVTFLNLDASWADPFTCFLNWCYHECFT